MGHYDNCYEAEEKEFQERKEKDVKNDFNKLVKKLTLDDKKFLNKIMGNIEDYKALDRLLSHKRK
jgi:hypothetical protein